MDGGAASAPPWWVARTNRSARERRNQRRRAAGRTVQELLRSLASIGEHRGCKRTVLGDALFTALQTKVSRKCGNGTKEADAVPQVDLLEETGTVCRPLGGGGEDSSVEVAKVCRPLGGGGADQEVQHVDPLVVAETVCRPLGGGGDSSVVAAKVDRPFGGGGVELGITPENI